MGKTIKEKMRFVWIFWIVFLLLPSLPAWGEERTHIVVLSDLHLPGKNISMKQKAIENINSWPDVNMVTALGDICFDLGTDKEYEYAQKFLAQLKKPFYPITGNHDYIYDDARTAYGRRIKAIPSVRKAKLEKFKEAFSLPDIRYARKADPYLLLFLSVDDLGSNYLAQLSPGSLKWLREELDGNKGMPALIFFHAPLKGTIMSENDSPERDDFIAQPEREIYRIIKDHPQIFLWVSGHTHIAPTHAKFNHPVNVYEKQVTNIHNCDMNGQSYLSDRESQTRKHENVWTHSLFLYPDKILVKTYDHKKGEWMEGLNREIFWKK